MTFEEITQGGASSSMTCFANFPFKNEGRHGFRSSENGYRCVSFLAARIPAAADRSHMYAPCFVFP